MYSEKISKIVDDISTLNFLEVADLNSLLKARLNISDAPVMMAGGAAPVAAKVEVGGHFRVERCQNHTLCILGGRGG